MISEQVFARTRLWESHSTFAKNAVMLAVISLVSSLAIPSVEIPQKMPEVKPIAVPNSSYQACKITLWNFISQPIFRPKTDLGKKLMALREKAISEGLVLWDADQIAKEVHRRRGEAE